MRSSALISEKPPYLAMATIQPHRIWVTCGEDLRHLLLLASDVEAFPRKAKLDPATVPVALTATQGSRWSAASKRGRPRIRLRPPLPT